MVKRRKVKRLIDGDSGWFADGSQFRLARVRAPEKHQFGGSTATRSLAGMLGRCGNIVSSKTVARDKYGRELVEFSNCDGSINERMRRKGYKKKGR